MNEKEGLDRGNYLSKETSAILKVTEFSDELKLPQFLYKLNSQNQKFHGKNP